MTWSITIRDDQISPRRVPAAVQLTHVSARPWRWHELRKNQAIVKPGFSCHLSLASPSHSGTERQSYSLTSVVLDPDIDPAGLRHRPAGFDGHPRAVLLLPGMRTLLKVMNFPSRSFRHHKAPAPLEPILNAVAGEPRPPVTAKAQRPPLAMPHLSRTPEHSFGMPQIFRLS
jgi:hypothetical protein